MKVFNFDPAQFTDEFTRHGYVHVKNGVNPEFLKFAQDFTSQSIQRQEESSLEKWRFAGKKMQFLFEFPKTASLDKDVKDIVGKVASIPTGHVTLCERHIKVYDHTAAPNPPAHKDRVASEITVGLPLQVPKESYLILYPDTHLDVNPYSSTALYRTSLDEDALPEIALKDVEPTKLWVWPGDVVFFLGSKIYHERVNPANTQLLYLKFNSMMLDPIGEDPETERLENLSISRFNTLDDDSLLASRVVISPKLDKLSCHYSRLNWQKIHQIYLWDKKEITAGEFEFRFIKSIRQNASIKELITQIGDEITETNLDKIKRLIKLNVLYLL